MLPPPEMGLVGDVRPRVMAMSSEVKSVGLSIEKASEELAMAHGS
jgi:hypothetical protein